MNDITIQQTEEEILTYEVSDEALETAAGKEKTANFTLGPALLCQFAPSNQFIRLVLLLWLSPD